MSEPEQKVNSNQRDAGIRAQALSALRQGKFEHATALLENDNITISELTQELLVHQTELELQAEELRDTALRHDLARHRFEALFETLPQAAFLVDAASGSLVQQNNIARTAFGHLRPSGVAAFPLRRIGANRSDEDLLASALADAARNGEALLTRVFLHREQGEPIPARVQFVQIAQEQCDAGHVLVLCIDETEQVRATAALEESEKRFREIAETIEDVFYTCTLKGDARWVCTYFSPGAQRIWGRASTADTESFSPLFTNVHPRDREVVRRALHATPAWEFSIEYRIVQPDGQVRWIENKGVFLDDCSRLIGAVRDITKIKITEKRLKLRVRQIEAVSRLLAHCARRDLGREELLSGIPQFLVDALNHPKLGVARIVVEGKAYDSAGWTPPSLKLRAPLRTPLVTSGYMELGYREVPPRAEEVGADSLRPPGDFLLSEREVFAAALRQVDAVVDWQKISEQLTEAERRNAIVDVTSGLVHELNTLLTVIIGQAEDMSDGFVPTAFVERNSRRILEAASRAADLTDHLQSFAASQSLHAEKLDLNAILRKMRPVFRRMLGADVALVYDLAEGLWPVFLDNARLESALQELCANAAYALEGKGELHISTRNVAENGAENPLGQGPWVIVELKDNGPGMDDAVLGAATEPFFSTHRQAGRGLGLSVVQGFTRQSGGRMALASQQGQGTTVVLGYRPEVQSAAVQRGADAPLSGDSAASP
ncbi:hybrid sensor histidine kinase/response regulator [Rhodovulum adriaticum]|uniref:histidine kinase n=1 Tax=Rhodovulum adriaticum TaxID=35804 RepID=A0A4R2NLU0_RHOAD|nr:hybrid sensor histidine kinase/response regulator [Rhodovulum adriaticum]MBK1635991.1 hypothetical protein [Rhodovulum adriaticum]TCP22422.1 PAS domain S-box-containing protein [Rhodovulum adriaticum]